MRQKDVLSLLRAGSNAFVTGAPGSGKTYVLGQFIAWARRHGKSVAVTASTGIAATHLGGRTIHSWAGVGISRAPSRWLLRTATSRRGSEIRAADILVIDEVSMLPASFLDLIDIVCRHVRRSTAPFGGLQVVLAGDLFQLPPVVRSDARVMTNPDVAAYFKGYADDGIDPNGYVTSSRVWARAHMPICYLTEQHRASGRLFDILNDIRSGAVSASDRQALEDRIGVTPAEGQAAVRLFPTNRQADRINQAQLADLNGELHTYESESNGDPALVTQLMKSMLAPRKLSVRQGAVVMALRNDQLGRYMNGSLGVVTDFDSAHSDFPIVTFNNGHTVRMEPESWNMMDGEDVLASVDQIPLRLAWAITIHKSQGMTLSAAWMDLSRTFAPGMGYVALSRVQSLDGLFLDGITPRALTVSDRVARIDKDLRSQSHDVEKALTHMSPEAFVTRTHRTSEPAESGKKSEATKSAATQSSTSPSTTKTPAHSQKSNSQPTFDFPTGHAAF